jgi:hypothetical protein
VFGGTGSASLETKHAFSFAVVVEDGSAALFHTVFSIDAGISKPLFGILIGYKGSLPRRGRK